ncbi:MAG: DUF3631 domain-containing protein, partial [Acidimicrobiales bacterium]|nr:DUF3631 domain-containing protein [Acidimicrobiales bacterium]
MPESDTKNFLEFSENISEVDRDLLDKAGISAEIANSRGYRTIQTKLDLSQLGFKPPFSKSPNLVATLWSPVDWRIVGYQLNLGAPSLDRKTSKMVTYKLISERESFLEANPFSRLDLQNEDVPLFVTFNIYDADALLSAGMCAISLIGLQGLARDRGGARNQIRAEFEKIPLLGRKVRLLLDHTIIADHAEFQYLVDLKSDLEEMGAEVSASCLPNNVENMLSQIGEIVKGANIFEALDSLENIDLCSESPLQLDKKDYEPVDTFEDVPEEDGLVLLDEICAFVEKYVSLSKPCYLTAVVLWILHTYQVKLFESTPRLAVLSPEKQSGKTRLFEVLELTVSNPCPFIGISAAGLYRLISSQPTILFDEVDTVFGVDSHSNEDLRGILNAGHRRTGSVVRATNNGNPSGVQSFPVYAAVALAGIGDLPDTIMDRSIVIPMRPQIGTKPAKPFRRREAEAQAIMLQRRLEAWAHRNTEKIASWIPEMPEGIVDRPADVWEPLLIVADVLEGQWPERARKAALEIVSSQKEELTSSS